MFKVDFEKTYNSVDWNFLDYIMLKIRFHGEYGNPTKEFEIVNHGYLNV
jgi:hypothetical protein